MKQNTLDLVENMLKLEEERAVKNGIIMNKIMEKECQFQPDIINQSEKLDLEPIIIQAREVAQEAIKSLNELNIDVEERHNVLVPGTLTTPERSAALLREAISESDKVTVYSSIDVCCYVCKFCRYYNKVAKNEEGAVMKIDSNLFALFKEMEIVNKELLDKKVRINSVYIGGGTPTLMTEVQAERLLGEYRKYYDIDEETEITMESTPDTINMEKLLFLRKLGVNRMSMGVQRLDDQWLKEMGRHHSVSDTLNSLKIFKESGMRFNIDLMYGFDGQTVESFCEDIVTILKTDPSEVTLYRFENQKRTDDKSILINRGNREDIYTMQEAGRILLESHGYIEGPDGWFTKKGLSRAQVYNDRWKEQIPMISFGPEAYSFSKNQQYTNKKHNEYYDALESGRSLLDSERTFEYIGEQKDLRRMIFDLKSKFQTKFNLGEKDFFLSLSNKGLGRIENDNLFILSRKGILVVEEIMRVLVEKSGRI